MKTATFNISVTIPTILYRWAVPLVLLYRKLRYGYTFRLIKLTRGQYAKVDPEDYEWLSQYKWHATKADFTWYAMRSRTLATKGRPLLMHRLIMQNQLDAERRTLNKEHPDSRYKLVIDHINGDGRDNRKANLRIATVPQNAWNSRYRKRPGRSKFRGVSWDKINRKWRVHIAVNRKRFALGRFKSEIEAAKAYDKAAKKYRGEFAVLNFPCMRG